MTSIRVEKPIWRAFRMMLRLCRLASSIRWPAFGLNGTAMSGVSSSASSPLSPRSICGCPLLSTLMKRRLTELRHAGKIIDTGRREPNAANRPEIVWEARI
nr:hypothetical protein DWF04_18500 [Cereibacter sphaeroides f. sp. denitrificans]